MKNKKFFGEIEERKLGRNEKNRKNIVYILIENDKNKFYNCLGQR